MKEILSGADGTWHEGFGTSQRILKGAGSEYPLNPLQDLNEGQLDAQYGAGTEALLNDIMQDMVWYQNSSHGEVYPLATMIFTNFLSIFYTHCIHGA